MSRLNLLSLEHRITPNTYTVTSTANSGANTLRQAILDSNGHSGVDSINFDPVVFASMQTITLSTGTLSITDELTITGPAAGVTLKNTLAGAHVIDVYLAPTATKINLENLTITGGGASGGLTAGVYATGQDLTLDNCVLTANTAANGVAAVSINGATSGFARLTVQNCTINNNQGTISGGIAVTTGSLLVENCTVDHNVSVSNGGGGIRMFGTVQAFGCIVRNCTVANNTAINMGGGIGLSGVTGTMVIQNCTIVNNVLTSAAANAGGGGVGRLTSGSIQLTSCIIAGNSSPLGPDIGSSVAVTMNNCAVSDSTGFTFTGSNNLPFQPIANLKLGSLAANGGPTKTIALLSGSPCLDAGSNPASLSTDQRGQARSVGVTDIGAFEVQGTTPKVAGVTVGDGTAQRSKVSQLVVTFDLPVSFVGSPSVAFNLIRQSDNAVVSLAAVVDPTNTMVTLSFTAGPMEGKSLADGRYTLTILANQFSSGFDGNGDGIAGDNYQLIGSPGTAPNLFRLYGDADGNGVVDGVDFGAFRAAFNTNSSVFDFDANGIVDGVDFARFRANFGVAI